MLISNFDSAFGEVTAKSVGFETTTIIEIENSGNEKIETVRLWLGSGDSFKSFKTEQGWTGKKTPQGVLVFTTSTPISSGESVKFGIKTDKVKPAINWKALDKNDEQIEIGKAVVSDLPKIEEKQEQPKEETTPKSTEGILSDSTFRIIPEKPKVGSSIRITGEGFGQNQDLDLYVDNLRLEQFETNENGFFIISSQVPDTLQADRVDFILKDKKGNEKSVSLRLGESEDRMAIVEEIPLTMRGLPEIVKIGDEIEIEGTATPGSTVTATVTNEQGEVTTTVAVDVDTNGDWSYSTIVSPETILGTYTAQITDGKETIERSWEVISSKTIEIFPIKLKYEPGETITFNGTVVPNVNLEVVIEDPQGNEIFGEIIDPGASGKVIVELPTQPSSTEGTYVLFATQGADAEISLVGLGELPEDQLIIKFDKLNYASGQNAVIELSGPPSSTISLLIIDPSDKDKFTDTVTLGLDGKATYQLETANYPSGVYTAVVTRGNAQGEDTFSIGLQQGSGPIELRTTKDTYAPGDGILVLGSSGENILISLALIDPEGNEIKTKETFTNKEGIFSEGSFRIPSEGISGQWKIIARSGPNVGEASLNVIGDADEGIALVVDKPGGYTKGEIVTISGSGASVGQQVLLTITDPDGTEVEELSFFVTGEGEFSTIWVVPDDPVPGTWKVKASDPFDDEEITFEVLS